VGGKQPYYREPWKYVANICTGVALECPEVDEADYVGGPFTPCPEEEA
jgi:hypothetical protein